MQKVVSSTVNVHFRLLNKGCRFSSFPAETWTQIEYLNDFFNLKDANTISVGCGKNDNITSKH